MSEEPPPKHLTVKERLYQIERTLQSLVQEIRAGRPRFVVRVEQEKKDP